MEWIIGLIIYLSIGIGILIYIVKKDQYGGFILHIWWIVIFFYPYLLISSLFSKK